MPVIIPNRIRNCIQSNGDVDLKFEGEYDRVGLQLVGGQNDLKFFCNLFALASSFLYLQAKKPRLE